MECPTTIGQNGNLTFEVEGTSVLYLGGGGGVESSCKNQRTRIPA